MTALSESQVYALAEQSRVEALKSIDRMVQGARKAGNPDAMLAAGLEAMRTAWAARSVGLMAAQEDTFHFQRLNATTADAPSEKRPNAVLLVAGNRELIDQVEALVREYERKHTG